MRETWQSCITVARFCQPRQSCLPSLAWPRFYLSWWCVWTDLWEQCSLCSNKRHHEQSQNNSSELQKIFFYCMPQY